jgi:hypothetical protein
MKPSSRPRVRRSATAALRAASSAPPFPFVADPPLADFDAVFAEAGFPAAALCAALFDADAFGVAAFAAGFGADTFAFVVFDTSPFGAAAFAAGI